MILWCIVPEIWSATDRIYCHFGPMFLPFYPLATWKIKILKKWKKSPGDTFILHKCTISDDHMMYSPWDMEPDRHNFLPFWVIFCPFTALAMQEIKILKKWKQPRKLEFKKMKKKFWRHHFRHVCQKLWSHDVWFLR